jgi:hypothetical protein
LNTSNHTSGQAIQELEDTINLLADRGILSDHEAAGLGALLHATIDRMRERRPEAAAAVLESFVNRIEEKVESHKLSTDAGVALIELAMRLLVE